VCEDRVLRGMFGQRAEVTGGRRNFYKTSFVLFISVRLCVVVVVVVVVADTAAPSEGRSV
jgi:hypothetical protein